MKLTAAEAVKILSKNPPDNWMEAMWKVYHEYVYPDGVPETQRVETKRAFFGGARALFEVQTGVFAGMSDDEAEQKMQQVHDEIGAFSEKPF